jgi:hypothetical protein
MNARTLLDNFDLILGAWSIHSKYLDINRLCLKMGRKSLLEAAFAI